MSYFVNSLSISNFFIIICYGDLWSVIFDATFASVNLLISTHSIGESNGTPLQYSFAWKIPWTGGAWQALVHEVAKSQTRLSDFFHFSLQCIGEGNGNPLQCSCLENPRDGGAWWAAVYGVAQSWTQLKRLSSSSRHSIQYEVFCDWLFSLTLFSGFIHIVACIITSLPFVTK